MTTKNDGLAVLTGRQPSDAEWGDVLHTLACLAEKQGRLDLAVRIAEAADAAGPFVPYATERVAR